jgi:hypothetical protein
MILKLADATTQAHAKHIPSKNAQSPSLRVCHTYQIWKMMNTMDRIMSVLADDMFLIVKKLSTQSSLISSPALKIKST